MTLDKFMKNEADDETVYYVGSNSAFVFIGTKADYEKYISPISSAYKMMILDKFGKASTDLHSYSIQDGDILFSHDCQTIKEKIDKFVDNYAMLAMKKAEELIGYQNAFKNFTHFSRREVVKDYERLSDGHAVIIAGDESGAFWLPEEFALFTSRYDFEISKYTGDITNTTMAKEAFNAFANRKDNPDKTLKERNK